MSGSALLPRRSPETIGLPGTSLLLSRLVAKTLWDSAADQGAGAERPDGGSEGFAVAAAL